MTAPAPIQTQTTKPVITPVAGGMLQRACACGQHTNSAGECDECKKKHEDTLQRVATNSSPVNEVPPLVHKVLRSPGQPLDARTRAFMEPRFDHDFSQVRVHTGVEATEAANAINALAYTVGHEIVFASGQYHPASNTARRLIAHELVHVVQQGAVNDTTANLDITPQQDTSEKEADAVAEQILHKNGPLPPASIRARPNAQVQRVTGGAGTAGGGATSPPAGSTSPARPRQLNIDVLAAEDPEDFLVRAAAYDLGIDIRVRSMDDMVAQVARLATAGSCVTSLDIFNHANPEIQTVVSGHEVKLPGGQVRTRPSSGFNLSWLFNNANRDALNRLRNSFCCNGEMRWFGCSTAGVLAEGGRRTEQELRASKRRYTDYRAEFYQSVEDAAAHGAMRFDVIGSVNVQSWANALCTPITAATDFNSWNVTGSGYTRTVVYGGRQIRIAPQADVACACDPGTGRISGTAPTETQMRQRATELREQALHPLYERTRSVVGREQPAVTESTEQRTTRESFERAQQEYFEQLGSSIRESILHRAGFARGARPTTPEEALRVVSLWGLNIGQIASALPTLTASLSGMLRGERAPDDLTQQQRDLEAALTPRGRETFMSALLAVRRDRFWNEQFMHRTIYVFPDLTGVNRYRGYTQTGTRTDNGRTQTIYVIHISRDLLNSGETELVTANLIHELTHTVHEPNVVERAMETFNRDLAELLADHPQVVALRSTATDAGAARSTHVARIRQMLYEVTGYAEAEIFAHLQQLTHQPSMTVDGRAIRGTDFILEEVTRYIVRLRRIGMPIRTLAGILTSIRRRTLLLYDRRIEAAPAGSNERRLLEANKQLADSIFQLALTQSAEERE